MLATPLTRWSSAARKIARAPVIPAPTNHAPPPVAFSEGFATTAARSSSQPLSEKFPSEFPTPLRQHATTRHPESDASRSDNATRPAGISSGGPLSTGNPCDTTTTPPLEPGGPVRGGSYPASAPAGPRHSAHTGEV